MPKESLQDYKMDFIDYITNSSYHKDYSAYSTPDWIDMIKNLASCLLVGANYNSHGSHIGSSIFNLAQALCDIEKGKAPTPGQTGRLQHPFAVPLQAGNDEEPENVFIEYVSNVIEGESSFFKKQDFDRDGVGHFVRKLFGETERNAAGKDVYIP